MLCVEAGGVVARFSEDIALLLSEAQHTQPSCLPVTHHTKPGSEGQTAYQLGKVLI